jgi:hypothetical protein
VICLVLGERVREVAMIHNPNPLCPSCGKPTQTLSHHRTTGTGVVYQKWFITRCKNVFCTDGNKYFGAGETIKAARGDFGIKYDEDLNEL